MAVQEMVSQVREALKVIFPEKEREARAALDDERAESITQEAELVKVRADEWVKNSTTFNRLNTKLDSVRKQLAEIEADWSRAYLYRKTVDFGYEMQQNRIHCRLEATAPAVIGEAIRELWKEVEGLREKEVVKVRYEKTGRQDHAGNEVLRVLTNQASVIAHRDGLCAAIAAIEELKAMVATEAEAIEAIHKIKAAIPPIGDPVAVQQGGETK